MEPSELNGPPSTNIPPNEEEVSLDERTYVPESSSSKSIPEQLRAWINSHSVRWLELLTNFGASNLFFISGDALVLEFLREAHISWGFGMPQFAHFVFAVERFLKQMLDAGCDFRIIFFRDFHRAFHDLHLSPQSVLQRSPSVGPAALLARDMLVAHLKNISSIVVDDSMDNWWSPNWRQYIEDEPPAFVLLSPMYNATGTAVTLLRAFALHLYAERVPTSYLAELQFTDNRIWGFCIEPYNRVWELQYAQQIAPQLPALLIDPPVAATSPPISVEDDCRSALIVFASQQLVGKLDSGPVALDLLKVVLLHVASLEHLELPDRAWMLPSVAPNSTLPAVLQDFLAHLTNYLDAGLLSLTVTRAKDATFVDLFDWRVFSMLLHALLLRVPASTPLSNMFPEGVLKRTHQLWSKITTETQFEPLFHSEKIRSYLGAELFDFLHGMPALPESDHRTPLPIRSPITDNILRQMLPEMPTEEHHAEQKATAQNAHVFRGGHHTHSDKRVTEGEFSLSDDAAGTFGATNRNKQNFSAFVEKYADSFNTSRRQWNRKLRHASETRSASQGSSINNSSSTSTSTSGSKLNQVDTIFQTNMNGSLAERRKALEMEFKSPELCITRDLYLVDLISQQIKAETQRGQKIEFVADLLVVVFDLVERYAGSPLLGAKNQAKLVDAVFAAGMPDLAAGIKKTLFGALDNSAASARAGEFGSSARFQLKHLGPWMERDIASQKHELVEYDVDKWQHDVVVAIEARTSLLVEAPTSAGKTFIALAAMKNSFWKKLEPKPKPEQKKSSRNPLKADPKARKSGKKKAGKQKEGDLPEKEKQVESLSAPAVFDPEAVVVYVAPTKALVNQIAAEVSAYFKDKLPNDAVQVFGIFTRDYRFCPSKCRILVTLPQCLEIMLLSPQLFPSWRTRLRYVIFDEVHTINQQQGAVWERLIAMVPCPFIALSATIGDTTLFQAWLKKISTRAGNNFLAVKHPYRYSDLQKNFLLVRKTAAGKIQTDLKYAHPWATFTMKQFARGAPHDISFSPRDCLELFEAMETAIARIGFPTDVDATQMGAFESMHPEKFFGEIVVLNQRSCRDYEQRLKSLFYTWTQSNTLRALARATLEELGAPVRRWNDMVQQWGGVDVFSRKFIRDALPATLLMLQDRKMLPAIAFSFDRRFCEQMGELMRKYFVAKEEKWRASSKYEKLVVDWNAEQKELERQLKRQAQNRRAADDDSAQNSIPPAERFGPGCTFTAHAEVMTREQINAEIKDLGDSASESLKDALRRGIGVHHAGLQKKYLQIVERYFRMGQLKIVFATGTLALGINMPCKTTIFVDDSNYLNPIEYRQMSGRAGRRGFDPVGNVVFFSVPPHKIRKLEASELPTLRGHFPYSPSFLLRSMILGCGISDIFGVKCTADLYTQGFRRVEAQAEPEPKPTPAVAALPDSWDEIDEDADLASVFKAKKQQKVPKKKYVNVPTGEPLQKLPEKLKDASQRIGDFFRDPFFAQSQEFSQIQVNNHVRFSLEFLIRSGLLNLHGETISLAGLAAHLSYTEPANFVVCQILASQAMRDLCSAPESQWVATSRNIIRVLSALFCRLTVPQNLREEYSARGADYFKPHQVIQDPLPRQFQDILNSHEQLVLDVFVSSVLQFIKQVESQIGVDNMLPLSGLTFKCRLAGDNVPFLDNLMRSVIATAQLFARCKIRCIARSPFVALSGYGDSFTSTSDLCVTVRSGVFLPQDAMPSLDIRDLSGELAPLNAYVLDMWNWKSGSNAKGNLEKFNHIRDGDAFTQFKEFMLMLKAVSTSLKIMQEEQEKRAPLDQETLAFAPVPRAFERLANEFEDAMSVLFGYAPKRRYVIHLELNQNDMTGALNKTNFVEDFVKPYFREKRPHMSKIVARFRTEGKRKFLILTLVSEADWTLVRDDLGWMRDGWEFVKAFKS